MHPVAVKSDLYNHYHEQCYTVYKTECGYYDKMIT